MPLLTALMSCAGLASAWKFASSPSQFMNAPQSVYWAIALGTAFFYLIITLLYALKIVYYRQKVAKEWVSSKSPMHVMPTDSNPNDPSRDHLSFPSSMATPLSSPLSPSLSLRTSLTTSTSLLLASCSGLELLAA